MMSTPQRITRTIDRKLSVESGSSNPSIHAVRAVRAPKNFWVKSSQHEVCATAIGSAAAVRETCSIRTELHMRRLILSILIFLGPLTSNETIAGDSDWMRHPMIEQYVGTWAIAEFLEEPVIRGELHTLLGDHLTQLEESLGVTGAIEYFGNALAVRGNAPHQGGEQEGIVCVQPWSESPQVHAGLYSQGTVTVYTRQPRYEYLPICVKDWIALVSGRHVHRSKRPHNVDLKLPQER